MAKRTSIDEYILKYWDVAKTKPQTSPFGSLRNVIMHLGRVRLPHPIVSPNHEYFAGTQYYWDSYFTVIGLLESGKLTEAKGMVDNLIFLFKKFGFFPARNSLTSFGRTQPPFFTRMVWEVYEAGAADDSWLNQAMKIASKEYETVWLGRRRSHHESGLSRYRPWLFKKLLTTYESGWDVSSRFALGRTGLLPVDLNCLLHQYEKDIAKWHVKNKRTQEAKTWNHRAEERVSAITTYFWDDARGFFYDFDLQKDRRDSLVTIAGLFPLWSKAATQTQADAVVANLDKLLQPHGLSTTQKLPYKHRQWDYPNAWPPLQLIAIEGLRNYGYQELADDITVRWLRMHQSVYGKTGVLWEKYDVVRGRKGKRGRYPTQAGFSWTNGVYLRLKRYSTGKER